MFYTISNLSCDISLLVEDDIVLAINGEIPSKPEDLVHLFDDECLEITVCRDGEVITEIVDTFSITESERSSVFKWCGATLEPPTIELKYELVELPSQIYLSSVEPGSPFELYQLESGHFVTHVNDLEVTTISDFKAAVSRIRDNSWVKLKVQSSDFLPSVHVIKTCYRYFPTRSAARNNRTREWARDM